MDSDRLSAEYKEWRRQVKARDGKYCQWPDCRRLGKQVHHIVRFASNLALRLEVNNGVLLCTKCHGKVKNKENDYAFMFIQIVERNAYLQEQKKKKK